MAHSGRYDWVDGAKGIGIVLVVIGHAWRGLNTSGDLISPDLFFAIDSRIYAFHMPLFFALSGLFLAQSLAARTPGAFVTDRLKRLFWPMVLWTYLFLAVKFLAGDAANTPVTPGNILIWPVPGHLHLWFLWALLLLHMAMLTTRGALKDGAFSPMALAGMTAVSVIAALIPWPDAVAYWIGPALRHAPFLFLGLWLGRAMQRGKGPTTYSGLFCIGAALVFVTILVVWQDLPDIRAVRLAGSLTLTFCLLTVAPKLPAPRWLLAFGASSMAIYLCHTIFSAACREALFVLSTVNLPLQMILTTAFGLVGPLIVLWVARRFGVARILGF